MRWVEAMPCVVSLLSATRDEVALCQFTQPYAYIHTVCGMYALPSHHALLPPHFPSYYFSFHIPPISSPFLPMPPLFPTVPLPLLSHAPPPFRLVPFPISSCAPPLSSPFSAGIQRRPSSHPVRVQRRSHPLEGLPPPPRLPQPPQASHLGPLQGIRTVSWAAQGGRG